MYPVMKMLITNVKNEPSNVIRVHSYKFLRVRGMAIAINWDMFNNSDGVETRKNTTDKS